MGRTATLIHVVAALALTACVAEGDPDESGAIDPAADEALGAPRADLPEVVDGAALGLISRVTIAAGTLGKDDAIVVRWSLSNEGARALGVPHWQVPQAELEEDVFAVERDGVDVRYYGKEAKRVSPRAEDLIVLEPGETVAADIELTRFYRMARAGAFTIRHADVVEVFTDGVAQRASVQSGAVAAVRTAENPNADVPVARSSYVTPGYQSCSSTRKSQIVSALSSAQTYATNALAYLTAGTVGTRYTTWFGSYTSTRYATVKSHFTNIRSAIVNQAYTFDCSCTATDTYAYVYPDEPYIMYFCGAFWGASNTGSDSRAGTIIHETSHYTVVAGTDDWAYGKTAAASLATSTPSKAIDNADSHEYFAENTPALN